MQMRIKPVEREGHSGHGQKGEDMNTKMCPNCHGDANNAIVLGDADPALEGLLECGCGAIFTERAARDGFAAAYFSPRSGCNLFRSPGQQTYLSVPGGILR